MDTNIHIYIFLLTNRPTFKISFPLGSGSSYSSIIRFFVFIHNSQSSVASLYSGDVRYFDEIILIT